LIWSHLLLSLNWTDIESKSFFPLSSFLVLASSSYIFSDLAKLTGTVLFFGHQEGASHPLEIFLRLIRLGIRPLIKWGLLDLSPLCQRRSSRSIRLKCYYKIVDLPLIERWSSSRSEDVSFIFEGLQRFSLLLQQKLISLSLHNEFDVRVIVNVAVDGL